MTGVEVQCKSLSGLVSSGKKATIKFDFTPNSLELVESFWRFTIPTLGLSVPILVVGMTKEPRVVIDKSQVCDLILETSGYILEPFYFKSDVMLPKIELTMTC